MEGILSNYAIAFPVRYFYLCFHLTLLVGHELALLSYFTERILHCTLNSNTNKSNRNVSGIFTFVVSSIGKQSTFIWRKREAGMEDRGREKDGPQV